MGHESDSPTPSASRSGPSGRKGSKKVRTGCITCKIRKVKCDEAKPFCTRCTKTGRRCDGYLDAKTMAQRRRRTGTGTLPGTTGCDPQAPPTLFFEWASADEKRSFHFFQHVTAPCLSGDFDGVFWRVLVLQICQSEPAVKHAVLAVSSLHEGMITSFMDAEDRHSFALSQYNKAITCLLDQMRNVDARPLVPLLTCVLFVCIELMQNKDKESLLHLEQGRQILSQLGRKQSSRSPEVDIIKQHLVPMYTRLSLTSWLIGCDPVAIPPPLKLLSDVPMMFDTIDDVRYALYDLMDECLRFAKRTHEAKFDDVSQEDMRVFEREQEHLLRKLSKFNVAFSLYQSSKAKDAPPGAIALIQVHVQTTFIWISTALSNNETVFDDYVSTFSSIVPLAASFIEAVANPTAQTYPPNKQNTPTEARRFSSFFTFEMHVIAPLYYVATKCRHPLIRRAALDLLRRNPARRENLWRANVMASIAEHTIRLEEKHLRLSGSSSPSVPLTQTLPPFITNFMPGDIWDTQIREDPLHPMFQPEVTSTQPPSRTFGFEPASVPTTASSDLDLSSLSGLGQLPIDPSLLYDASEVRASSAHSFSAAPSIASSFDDLTAPTIYVGGSGTSGATNIASDITSSSAPAWGTPFASQHSHSQPSQHSQHARRQHHSAPEISLAPPTPMGRGEDPWMFDSRPNSGVSSSLSSEESEGLGSPGLMGVRSPDAPFDVPEQFRVREAIIGPDKEDGICIMMFRKLGGLNSSWDVQTEYVAVA